MAALSEADLIKILGENARAQIEAASESKNEDPAAVRKRALLSILLSLEATAQGRAA